MYGFENLETGIRLTLLGDREKNGIKDRLRFEEKHGVEGENKGRNSRSSKPFKTLRKPLFYINFLRFTKRSLSLSVPDSCPFGPWPAPLCACSTKRLRTQLCAEGREVRRREPEETRYHNNLTKDFELTYCNVDIIHNILGNVQEVQHPHVWTQG